MIDPSKLPAAAVEAACPPSHPDDRNDMLGRTRERIAAFLDALLADDEAMARGTDAWVTATDDWIRAALHAAVQEN